MAASNLQDFITEWTGKIIPFQNVPNGSCMAVPHQYIFEVLGLTDPFIVSGQYAYEVYTNFQNLPAAQYFTLIANSPTNVPSAGDIIVFGQNENDTPEGHVAIFVSGDINSFISFDQNYPTGSTAHLQNHVYTGSETVVGWLHYNDPTQATTQNVPVTDQQSADLLNAQIQATSACQSQLKAAQDQITTLQNQLTTETEQVQSLQDEKKSLTDQITTLQTQLSDEQKEIVNLNTQIETQASSNKDFASEIYTLTHDNQALTTSLNSVVDGLGIVRGTQTLDQITKAALSKEDDIDTLLKAAGVASGILHNVVKELGLDDPNLTDQQAGNKIIQYVKKIVLKNPLPQSQQASNTAVPTKSYFSRLVGWFWQPKT